MIQTLCAGSIDSVTSNLPEWKKQCGKWHRVYVSDNFSRDEWDRDRDQTVQSMWDRSNVSGHAPSCNAT